MRGQLSRNLRSPLPARHYGSTERFNHVLPNGFSDEFKKRIPERAPRAL